MMPIQLLLFLAYAHAEDPAMTPAPSSVAVPAPAEVLLTLPYYYSPVYEPDKPMSMLKVGMQEPAFFVANGCKKRPQAKSFDYACSFGWFGPGSDMMIKDAAKNVVGLSIDTGVDIGDSSHTCEAQAMHRVLVEVAKVIEVPEAEVAAIVANKPKNSDDLPSSLLKSWSGPRARVTTKVLYENPYAPKFPSGCRVEVRRNP